MAVIALSPSSIFGNPSATSTSISKNTTRCPVEGSSLSSYASINVLVVIGTSDSNNEGSLGEKLNIFSKSSPYKDLYLPPCFFLYAYLTCAAGIVITPLVSSQM